MKTASTTAMTAYLNSIGRVKRLTPEETSRLFHEMHDAREKGDVKRAEHIRERLITANLRLVVSLAKYYAARTQIDIVDLVQEGSLGLIEAIERYDPDRGFQLSTYAAHWIKCAIRRHITGTTAIAGARLVRLPAHITSLIPRIKRFINAYKDEHGVMPSDEEIAVNCNTSTQIVRATLDAWGSTHSFNLHDADAEQRTSSSWVAKIEHAIAQNTQDFSVNLDAYLEAKEVRSLIERALTCLTPQEAHVLKMRFGIETPNNE